MLLLLKDHTDGRVICGIAALAMCVDAVLIWPQSRVAGISLALSSAFVAFEAARGWCALRVRRAACGVKTKF